MRLCLLKKDFIIVYIIVSRRMGLMQNSNYSIACFVTVPLLLILFSQNIA